MTSRSTATHGDDRRGWTRLAAMLPVMPVLAWRLVGNRHELALALPGVLRDLILLVTGFAGWVALAFVAAALVVALRHRGSRR